MMNDTNVEMALVEVHEKNGVRRELWDLTDYQWKIVTVGSHVFFVDGDREGAIELFRDLCASH